MSKPTSKFYYNAEITNTGKNLSIPATFDVSLAHPLLENPSEYCMVVQKFSMDTEGIPVSVIELKQPQTPKIVNFETIHNVYMADVSGNTGSSNVFFNTEAFKNVPPKPVKENSDGTVYYNNKDPYFFVYHYNSILKMINNALLIAFNLTYPGSLESPPQFIFDPTTQLITLYSPISIFQNVQEQEDYISA